MRRVLIRRAITALRRPRFVSLTDRPTNTDLDLDISVRQTLSRLDPVDHTILALAHFEQLSYAEIAVELGIPPGTVASRLHHARAAFKEAWQA